MKRPGKKSTAYLLTEQRLYELYVVQQLTIYQIAEMEKIGKSSVFRSLQKFSIPIRSKTEAMKRNWENEIYKSKMSLLRSGENNPNFGKIGSLSPNWGKHHTEETKNKISQSNFGKHLTEETKAKLAKINSGKKHTEEAKAKMRLNHPRKSGKDSPNWGNHLSEEQKSKLSKAFSGENNPNWKKPEDRKTLYYQAIRTTKLYKKWRTDVYKRDNWKCVNGCLNSKLNADHIIPFSLLLKTYKIKTTEEAKNCKELWDLSNGRTLCEDCHRKTDTYANGAKNLLKEI